jgi:hypothetical protein
VTLNFACGAGVPANTSIFIMMCFDSKFTITFESEDRQVTQVIGVDAPFLVAPAA